MNQSACRHFTGYKPCERHSHCHSACPSLDIPSERVLFIHLGALGAVLRSTSLLPALHRKHPKAHLTWVTASAAAPLLQPNPWIDQVLPFGFDTLMALQGRRFDAIYCLDKEARATGLTHIVQSKAIYGFVSDPVTGGTLPATDAARELWELGLNNHRKFHVNTKPEQELCHEALELGEYLREDYQIFMTPVEEREALNRAKQWRGGQRWLIGINTGCSPVMPHKKLTVEFQRELVRTLQRTLDAGFVLLGGPEDTQRNQRIAYGLDIAQSPTERGLRDGFVSTAACDLIISGDSLGMHMAIGLRKKVVAWFGPTCPQEIELYGRGLRVLTKAKCSPCWKRNCSKTPMCYDLVDLGEITASVLQLLSEDKTRSRRKPERSVLTSI